MNDMKKIWIVSLLLLGCFAARAQAPAPLKGRIAVSVPRVDMRLSYAEYDKAFSGDLRTAQTDLEGRYMLPDDDKIYAVTLCRRSGSGSSTPSCVCSTAASRSAVAPTSARTPRRRCRPTTSPASPSRSKRWWSTIRCSPSRCAKGAMRRFSTSSARCTSGFSTPDTILK